MAGNYLLLAVLSFTCVVPMWVELMKSVSAHSMVDAGYVTLWPVKFTLASYSYALANPQFLKSLTVSLERVLIAVPISMLLTMVTAYPLAKEGNRFRLRTWYVWFFIIDMIFQNSLIPTYMTVKETGLLNTIWALTIPGALNVFNVVLLLNFFRRLPRELEESAYMDGAGHWQTLWRVYIPLSTPALATLTLFVTVGQWNEWFGGIIYMSSPAHYPLASFLRMILEDVQNTEVGASTDYRLLELISTSTVRSVDIMLAAAPILLVYPFLQKYFVKGIVLGSVKE